MSTLFVRPGHLHTASRALSASSEAGLTVAPPIADADNAGTLRLRATGRPTLAAALDVQLQTGGNPSGYALATSSGQGLGAAAIWKRTTDAAGPGSLDWRGYIDTPYLVRVDYPVAYGTGLGKPSKPRTLANGDLGFVVAHSDAGSTMTFTRITSANVATTTTIDSNTFSSTKQADLAVFPDGRLVVIRILSSELTQFESDDNGATWSTGVSCGGVVAGQDMISLEYVDDLLVMVISSSTAIAVTDVRVSQDGGYNWTSVDTSQTLRGVRTCVTTTGKILAIATAGSPLVREIAPGGGLSTSGVDSDLTCNTGECALVTRDDGAIWAFTTNSTTGLQVDLDASASLDGGVTWANPLAGRKVWNANSTITNAGYQAISAGCWQGKVIILAQTLSAGAGSDNALHMYTLGGWESVTEQLRGTNTVYTYDHCLLPVDLPDALDVPWTRIDTGAGATVTNEGPLRFVSTGANASYFTTPPPGFLAASNPGGSYRIRYRCRQVSGGSVVANGNGFHLSISDGAGNHQGFKLRMSTTEFRLVDDAGTLIDTTVADMTKVTDFLFAFKHDSIVDTSGRLAYWYKQDGDETWTLGSPGATVAEVADASGSQLRVGGQAPVVGTHDLYWLGLSDDSNTMDGNFINPDDLVGRSLGTVADYYLDRGIHLGGRNAGGKPGDAYTVSTTYQYGKEAIWRELRPSKKCHSTASNLSWNVVFDAGATDQFKGDTVGLFGTNFRTATIQMNATDSWGAPSVSKGFDATLVTGTIGAGNRGPGYVGPTTSLNWRPGQFKSDGDAHRYFLDVGGTVYEITDNDEDRIYVEGVDFSAAVGTYYVFGDKMAGTLTFSQYRYMRLLVGAQGTPAADACYHVGTLIFDKAFTPVQTYDHGFVDRIEPNVAMTETDAGYQASSRAGPRRYTLAIQWSPIAVQGPASDLEARLRDFYASLEGSQRPFMFWRDTTDVSSVGLYTFEGVYQASNVWGERGTALTRVDQLIVREHF